jgi:hypothetical protein
MKTQVDPNDPVIVALREDLERYKATIGAASAGVAVDVVRSAAPEIVDAKPVSKWALFVRRVRRFLLA